LCAVESRNGTQGLLGYVYCAGADRGFHDAHLVVAAGDDSDRDVQLVGGVPERVVLTGRIADGFYYSDGDGQQLPVEIHNS
jgi:hypothetical protein